MTAQRKLGDFTGLADHYTRYRPAYAPAVVEAIAAACKPDRSEAQAADVGAGTGIWTRMLVDAGIGHIFAIEPNDDMRAAGIAASQGQAISWSAGSGEATGLESASIDLLTMASSFHWVDFDAGCAEFARVLRPGGHFVAAWNPRLIEASELLSEIEAQLYTLAPQIERRSSGRSAFTETLFDRLEQCPWFDQVLYLESRHAVRQTPDEYLGVWQSVNDVRAQAGELVFARFLAYVRERVAGLPYIETTYLTRAWGARRGA